MPLVELRPLAPVQSRNVVFLEPPRRGADVIDAGLEDWAWAMRLEEELDYALLIRDDAASHRQRLVGRVRVVALLALVAAVLTVAQVATHVGLVIALLAAWAAPVAVLGVVLCAEKVLLRITR